MKFDIEEPPTVEGELVSSAPIVPAQPDGLSRQAYLDGLDDELFERNASVVAAMARWPEIDPSSKDVPPEWIQEFGGDLKRATETWRVARASWLSNKEAPVGLQNSVKLHIGLSSARAKRGNTVPRTLNLQPVFITLPEGTFERLDPIEIKEKP